MAADVTIKMSVAAFDELRKAVAFARDQSDAMWKEAKERGDDAYRELYTFTVTCGRLLDHTLA